MIQHRQPLPPGVGVAARGVAAEAWREELDLRLPDDPDATAKQRRDRKQKAFARAVEGLHGKGRDRTSRRLGVACVRRASTDSGRRSVHRLCGRPQIAINQPSGRIDVPLCRADLLNYCTVLSNPDQKSEIIAACIQADAAMRAAQEQASASKFAGRMTLYAGGFAFFAGAFHLLGRDKTSTAYGAPAPPESERVQTHFCAWRSSRQKLKLGTALPRLRKWTIRNFAISTASRRNLRRGLMQDSIRRTNGRKRGF